MSHSATRAASLFLVGALLVALGPTRGLAAGRKDADDIEEFEPVKATTPAPATLTRSARILAVAQKLHAPLVHLPIGWLVLLLVIDGATFVRRKPWGRVGWPLLGGVVGIMVPTVITGLLRARALGSQANADLIARIHLHRNAALLLFGLAVLALVLRTWRANLLEGGWKVVYLVLLAGLAALLVVVGHLGGRLVFGDGYLAF